LLAIAVNALFTTRRKRGTTRQLAWAIVASVVSAVLLLLVLLWYNLRFNVEQANLSAVEIALVLLWEALWGWMLPLGTTTIYCLFTAPRDSNTSAHIPRHKRTTRADGALGALPRRQPGVPAPFVYGSDIPWGWLEYHGGRFQGQELALKRSVVAIGREEDNDIWLDGDTISRYHAELVWDKGQVYITDCNSLNGVLLNRQRIRSTTLVKKGDLLEIGAHHFVLKYAERPVSVNEEDDPLLPHLRRAYEMRAETREGGEDVAEVPSTPSVPPPAETMLPTKPLLSEAEGEEAQQALLPGRTSARRALPSTLPGNFVYEATGESEQWKETAELDYLTPSLPPRLPGGLCVICSGEMTGRSFLLDRPVLTVGRGSESDITIYDVSISRRHAQFLRQADGDYIQDLASRNGTRVNGELLQAPRLLAKGDSIMLGDVRVEYTPVAEAKTTPMPSFSIAPGSGSGPQPLRLPSKPRD
jgi:pSer/pThr/pTyr-binding forkhead associated (FHA) protein